MIFVSHAFEDQNRLVNDIVKGLIAAGLEVWYSREKLKNGGGGFMFERFNAALSACDASLTVLTPAYLRSTFAQKELNAIFNMHAYDAKPIIVVAVGLTMAEIRRKYPLIGDAYTFIADPNDSMQQLGEQIGAYIQQKEPENEERRILPVLQPARGTASAISKWKKWKTASIVSGSLLLLVLGAWVVLESGLFWHYTPARPVRQEHASVPSVMAESLFHSVKSVVAPKTQPPAKGCGRGMAAFMRHPEKYRVYLGDGRFCAVEAGQKTSDCDLEFIYEPPGGWNVSVSLHCEQGFCSGTYDGWLSDGRLVDVQFYEDGTALGRWQTMLKIGGSTIEDTFAIVKIQR